jgi:hypothetical protein
VESILEAKLLSIMLLIASGFFEKKEQVIDDGLTKV